MKLRLTEDANADIAGILDYSVEQFGVAGRVRYETLIETAFQELLADPYPAVTTQFDDSHSFYHLRYVQQTGPVRVGRPRHIVVYRVDRAILVVVRLLHDAMDLRKHHDSPPPP